jgi:hypothetical protein
MESLKAEYEQKKNSARIYERRSLTNGKAIVSLMEMLNDNFPYPYYLKRDFDLSSVRSILNMLFLYRLITKKERKELMRYYRACASKRQKKRVAS